MDRSLSPSPNPTGSQHRRGLFADNEPISRGWLSTGGPHEIYYEECGAANGRPCVILHGGPGGAINPTMRRFFDPKKWRMGLFDQRGCGRSRPNASLEEAAAFIRVESGGAFTWDEMARYAHTYAYDGRIMHGLQDGKPLPTDRWNIDIPIAVAVGGNGEDFIREGAAALAALLPNVTVLTLPDHDHSAFWTAPEAVARQAHTFLNG